MDKQIFPKYTSQGLKPYIVMISDKFGNPPNTTACKAFQAQNSIGATVLYDATGATAIYGSKETNLVVNENGVITAKIQGAEAAKIDSAIAAEIAQ